MRRARMTLLAILAVIAAAMVSPAAASASGPATETGTIDGANFLIQMPSDWNGTLVLYSHGYVIPGSPLVAMDAGDPLTAGWLLDHGYAIAGSSYSQNGWALQQAFHDQIALLDHFQAEHPDLKRTIAWGHSLGGMITAGLIQLFPDRFAGAIPMCGVVAGGPGVWNQGLDAEFVFKTLLAPTAPLQLVNITDAGNLQLAEGILAGAQGSPPGRLASRWWRPSATPPDGSGPAHPSRPRSTSVRARPTSSCGTNGSRSHSSSPCAPRWSYAPGATLLGTQESTTACSWREASTKTR